jgi:hypothetical protein
MLGFKMRGLGLVTVFAVLASIGLAGCGSGNGNGAIAVTIQSYPAATQSLVVALSAGPTLATSQTINNPAAGGTATASFTALLDGTYTVTVSAYNSAGGAGTLLATGTNATIGVAGGQTSQATVNLIVAVPLR